MQQNDLVKEDPKKSDESGNSDANNLQFLFPMKRKLAPDDTGQRKRIKLSPPPIQDRVEESAVNEAMLQYAATFALCWTLLAQQSQEILNSIGMSIPIDNSWTRWVNPMCPPIQINEEQSNDNSINLSESITNIDGTTRYKCPECPKHYSTSASLRRHFMRHTNSDSKFQCPECYRRFTRPDVLKIHAKRFHNGSFNLGFKTKSLKSVYVQTDPYSNNEHQQL